jgi:hypothetical protein
VSSSTSSPAASGPSAPPAAASPSPGRRLFEVVTVGLPFSTFKLLVGLHLLDGSARAAAGVVLCALGALDLAMNVGNLVGLLIVRRPFGPLCVLHGAMRALRGPHAAFDELGLALDTALAFLLVAGMIAAGRLTLLAPVALAVWNVAVILNVLGAGTLRLLDAIDRAAAAARAPG